MTTVADILNYVETFAPASMKEDWDRVGLNCGRMTAPVTKVLVALDPFDEAIDEAIAMGAQLLLTHHVLIYEPGFLTDQTVQGRRVLKLLEHGIAHINAHTNLDVAPGGVNDALARTLGLQNAAVIHPMGQAPDGTPYGLLRAGEIDTVPLPKFLSRIKERLGTPVLRYADGGSPVHRVAVGGGACGSEIYEALQAGCDTFVTSDLKYNHFRDAQDSGLNLIDAGHFYTENPVCGVLAEKLRTEFPEITVKISQKQHDCINFI